MNIQDQLDPLAALLWTPGLMFDTPLCQMALAV